MPFVPNLGDKLRRAAGNAGFRTWFTYPGKVFDLFSQHRGRPHSSKTRNSVYQCYCNCGTGYIGESSRNLKVRVAEHLHTSSASALTVHLRKDGHKLVPKDTIVLATEGNLNKRRLIESICIHSRSARICNIGQSIEYSPVWDMCSEHVDDQLSTHD